MNCLNCDTAFEAKRSDTKFCSTRCKQQWNRNNRITSEEIKRINDTDNPQNVIRINDTDKLTKTDQLFETHQPGYYKFSDKIYERECFLPSCGEKFKTRLQLLKYCSPQHYTEGLDLIVRLMTKGKK